MKTFWTFVFIAICAMAFVLEPFVPMEYFSFTPAHALTRPWAFVTSIFLHANFEHLFFNMFALFMFGIYLEARIKQRNFVLIFFLAGIVGNLGYALTAPNAITPAVGASGAIYGVMGTLAVLMPSATVYIGYMPMPMIFAAFIWTITEFLGLFVPGNIAHESHLAGLFIGVGYGLYLRYSMKNKSYKS